MPRDMKSCHGDVPTNASLQAAITWLANWQQAHALSNVFRQSNESAAAQRVPRHIFQTVNTNASEFATTSTLVRAWSALNPEYSWHLFDEDDCTSFVEAVATDRQKWTYHSLLAGAARSDLFRILALLYLGGVYSDVDVELRRPLRTLVDANASMILSPRIQSEWLVSESQHPILRTMARSIENTVERQVELWRTNSSSRCISARECIVETTGPFKFAVALEFCAATLGCLRPSVSTYPRFRTCANASNTVTRRTRVCVDEELVAMKHAKLAHLPSMMRGWDCGVAYHRRCVGNRVHPCSSGDRRPTETHYTAARVFFNLSLPRLPRSAAVHHSNGSNHSIPSPRHRKSSSRRAHG